METKEPKKQDEKILNNKCEPEMCFIKLLTAERINLILEIYKNGHTLEAFLYCSFE